MENKRIIPYGVINWATLVRECLFVDNTAYIRALEPCRTPVFLRPKRFGKSVVCSMLAHYYDVNLKDSFEELFGMTDIGRNPTPLRNSFLVLQFDFSTVQVGSLAEIERNFWENIKGTVRSFAAKYGKLADWSMIREATGPADCIDKVRDVIRDNGLPPLYVIIDEYDNFTNELVVSNRDIEYNAVCGHDSRGDTTRESFFKAFFKSFKAGLADGTVGRTYFTGVLPITLDDLSSGFNVGTVVNLNPDILNLVGFTKSQVEKYVDDVYAEHGFDRSNREAVLADLKKTSKLDPKLFGDANVSTSITFVAQTAMRSGAFPDAYTIVPAVVRLAKGELSELISTGLPGHGAVVYVEDRQPGQDAAAARAQFKAGIQRERDGQGGLFIMNRLMQPQVQAWCEANMARFDVQPTEGTSMKDSTDEGDSDDGEGSQD